MYWNHFVIISTIDLNNFVAHFIPPLWSFCVLSVEPTTKKTVLILCSEMYAHVFKFVRAWVCMRFVYAYALFWQQILFHLKLYKRDIAYFDSKSISSTHSGCGKSENNVIHTHTHTQTSLLCAVKSHIRNVLPHSVSASVRSVAFKIDNREFFVNPINLQSHIIADFVLLLLLLVCIL